MINGGHMILARPHFRWGSLLLCMGLGMCLLPSGSGAELPPTPTDAILYERPYTELATVAGKLGMRYQQSRDLKAGTLSSRWTSLKFSQNSKVMLLNNFRIFLGFAVAGSKGKLYLSSHDMRNIIRPLLTPQVFSHKPRLKKIVIDPGHGGRDPGCSNESLGMLEKDIVLAWAMQLKEALQERGYQVLLTRHSDRYVENTNRFKYANDVNADLFLSLHFNSVPRPSVHGIETYVYTPLGQPSSSRSHIEEIDLKARPANHFDPWSTLAGFNIQRQLIQSIGGVDRGLKRARFSMLSGLNCPGVLIEGGFFSNRTEAKKIKSAWHRKKLAEAVAVGVDAYHNTLKKISGKDA